MLKTVEASMLKLMTQTALLLSWALVMETLKGLKFLVHMKGKALYCTIEPRSQEKS